jgi:hypothetical protein
LRAPRRRIGGLSLAGGHWLVDPPGSELNLRRGSARALVQHATPRLLRRWPAIIGNSSRTTSFSVRSETGA